MMCRFFFPFVFSLLFLFSPDSSSAKYKVVSTTSGGTITGRVGFKGDPPAPVKYIITKDHDACGKGQVTRQEVDVKDSALRGVIVYLHKVKKGKAFSKKIQSVVVDQKKCAYVPYLQVVAEGGKVTILNSDADHRRRLARHFGLRAHTGFQCEGRAVRPLHERRPQSAFRKRETGFGSFSRKGPVYPVP